MRRDLMRAPLCALFSGLVLSACGGPLEDTGQVSTEPLGTQESALCSGTAVNGLSIYGASSWGGELAANGGWSVSGGANAVRLEYWLNSSLHTIEERLGATGTWYFSTPGLACGHHTFEVKAWPMVVDSAGTRTTCMASPSMTTSQMVAQDCPTASLSCTRNFSTGDLNCTGSASGGNGPYQYFWQSVVDGVEYGWYQDGSTYADWCPRGFYENGYYWNLQVQFRVVDAAGMSSNIASRSYSCSSPGY